VVWVLIVFYPFLRGVDWAVRQTGSESPYMVAAAIPVAISLFHTFFNVLNTFVLVWFVKPIARLVKRLVPERGIPEKEIDEPKFLNKKALRYPETLIISLLNESKYLYKNAVFEIVAHGLNLSRADIKSDLKVKKIVKKSTDDFGVDVEELYYSKVKNIYGEIISYATRAQSILELTEDQNKKISDIKIANRKMVEIIKDVRELNKNVVLAMNLDNKSLQAEYDGFRKKVIKVLRVIYLFRTEEDSDKYADKLKQLRKQAKDNVRQSNKTIDKMIRKELINAEMASSLFNDYSNVNDMIRKLIEVAELLYSETDPLFEN
jgi:phosphate:Na+ symporter